MIITRFELANTRLDISAPLMLRKGDDGNRLSSAVKFLSFLQKILISSVISLSISGCNPIANRSVEEPLRTRISKKGIEFRETSQEAGLTYRWTLPLARPLNILNTIGNGVAFPDYDADGNLDILLVGPTPALYRGDGKGRFTDVTKKMGLNDLKGHFLGCAVGDFDNDGFPDLYLSGYREGRLLHNESGKRFRDITAQSGISPQSWGTSAAFADIDGDGLLDLFVGGYAKFDSASTQLCLTGGVKTSCPPGTYDGESGRLYKNLGGGRFKEVTQAWLGKSSIQKTLGVAFADFDDSGRPSLALANDEVPGDLCLNLGTSFKSVGAASGVAYSAGGQPHAGMGQDWGDYDNDGRLDLAVMTFSTEIKPIYHNDGSCLFTDQSPQLGITRATTPYVAFGVKWLDADNDGWLDLMMTNGHTSDNIAETGQGLAFKQPTLLFRNSAGTRFDQVDAPSLDLPIVGRGLAIGDYDNDGRVDVLISDADGAVRLLHNETPNAGHWLTLKLIGRKGCRDATGAIITLKTTTQTLTRYAHSDGSYLSSSDPRVHFGLGKETKATQISIKWRKGAVQTLTNVTADRILTIEEGLSPK